MSDASRPTTSPRRHRADRRAPVRGARPTSLSSAATSGRLRVGRERQPALLGRRRRRRDHRRPDRAAVDAVGLVPAPPLGAGPHRAERAAAGALRPEGALRASRGDHERQHHRVLRRRSGPATGSPAASCCARSATRRRTQARHRPVLGDRRRVPQPARRARRRRVLHRIRLPARRGTTRATRDDVRQLAARRRARWRSAPDARLRRHRHDRRARRARRRATGGRCTTTTTSR